MVACGPREDATAILYREEIKNDGAKTIIIGGQKLLLQCRGTVVRSVWKRGRPARPRLLRHCNRARREWFCVLPNGVAFRATVLAQQARRLKMPLQMWGPQTSSMTLPRRYQCVKQSFRVSYQPLNLGGVEGGSAQRPPEALRRSRNFFSVT